MPPQTKKVFVGQLRKGDMICLQEKLFGGSDCVIAEVSVGGREDQKYRVLGGFDFSAKSSGRYSILFMFIYLAV